MKPHFYNFRSRLGMINLPYRQSEFNIGVEYGGDAILSNTHFGGGYKDVFDFPKPEETTREKYYKIIAEYSAKAAALIEQTIKSDEVQVVVGGDHSVSFPSLIALMKRIDPATIAHIQIDSHVDMNRISTSPTGNFHGMWMRPFVGGFDNDDINKLVSYQYKPEQLFFIGNIDLDEEEKRIFKKEKLKTFSLDDIRNHYQLAINNFQTLIANFSHIHLDIDIDGFDSSIAPATGIPQDKGLLWNDVEELLRIVSKTASKSVNLVEVNPQKPGARQTIELVKDILKTLL